MIDQATQQSVTDNVTTNNNPTPAPAVEEPVSHDEPAATPNEDSNKVDLKEIGKIESEDDKFAALIEAGYLADKKPEPTPEPEPEAKEEEAKPAEQPQTYKLKISGEEKEVSYDELIKLAQMGGDYTRKTQELAAERKRYDELLSKVAGQKAQQPTPEEVNKNKKSEMEAQYKAAVAEAEKMLGIEHGDFNEFDSTHSFALQQVMLSRNTQQLAENQLKNEIAEWSQAQASDPMSQEIDNNFDHFIYQMGAQSAEGQQKALVILAAKARFMAGNPSRQDCDILKGHWEYVRSALNAKKAAEAAPAPEIKKPEPPSTEAPGTGNSTPKTTRFSKQKLRDMASSPDDQLAMLRKQGFI